MLPPFAVVKNQPVMQGRFAYQTAINNNCMNGEVYSLYPYAATKMIVSNTLPKQRIVQKASGTARYDVPSSSAKPRRYKDFYASLRKTAQSISRITNIEDTVRFNRQRRF